MYTFRRAMEILNSRGETKWWCQRVVFEGGNNTGWVQHCYTFKGGGGMKTPPKDKSASR